LINEGAEKLAQERATAAADRVKKGEDMAAVAKSMNVTVNTAKNFGREGNVDGIGPAIYLEDAFVKPVGTVIGPSIIQGREIVAKSTEKTEANMDKFSTERDALLATLKTAKARERNALLMDSIMTKLIADGKVVKHQEEIQRTLALFRN
jgi:parvulin-like peptidyl-prolyl isomerase